MKALFVTLQEVKRKSIFDGNLDPDKFIQFIEVAQDINIQMQLGTALYEKLQNDIINDTLSGNYLSLVNDYVKPMLIWYAQATYLPFAAYQVGNGGIYKHTSENSEVATVDEVNMLVEEAKEKADFYTQRFIDYMSFNSHLYPEFNQNQDEGMYPNRDINFTGWVL